MTQDSPGVFEEKEGSVLYQVYMYLVFHFSFLFTKKKMERWIENERGEGGIDVCLFFSNVLQTIIRIRFLIKRRNTEVL